MDQEQAISQARQFADRAHSVAVARIARETEEKLAAMRNQAAARGNLVSGYTVDQTARIRAEQFTTLLQSRLDSLLEGFDLHQVTLDDQLVDRVVRELASMRSTWIASDRSVYNTDAILGRRLVSQDVYVQLVERYVGMSENEIRTQIDRRRFIRMKNDAKPSINIAYHIHGHNNRWVTNSQDRSVNVVTQSSEQIFTTLREQLESSVPAGDEQKDILERLKALEQAQSSPSFKQRYTEFISAAANHMTLIAPFIPALTEMLQRHL